MLEEGEIIRLLFGFKIKYLRLQKGYGLEELAERTGLSKSYVHDIEKGRKYPKVDKIDILAKGLGVEYDYLVSRRADRKLQPVVDLLTSDILKEFPLQKFGIDTHKLLELLATTPDRVNAFIQTITGVARNFQLKRKHIYFTALRALQALNDNYFPALEAEAARLRTQVGGVLSVDQLTTCLRTDYGVSVDQEKMGQEAALASARAYYAKRRKVLYLQAKLSTAQIRFAICREIAFQAMDWPERPYLTRLREAPDFETLFNNFRASYLASAMLMPEDQLVADLAAWFAQPQWDEVPLRECLQHYAVSPETLLQRITNVLPRHFGIEELFFIRLQADDSLQQYRMTKELHLAQPQSPYANALDEHYCRRWVSVNIIKQARHQLKQDVHPQAVIDAQLSEYVGTDNAYLCLSMAMPKADNGDGLSSVTIGLLVNEQLRKRISFLADPNLPTRLVNTTCERCPLSDCDARVVPPLALERDLELARIHTALRALE
jgi:transcriptional regulator with XRE-family HTH domain/Zn-dependent peptidase ImmA (M78 family)